MGVDKKVGFRSCHGWFGGPISRSKLWSWGQCMRRGSLLSTNTPCLSDGGPPGQFPCHFPHWFPQLPWLPPRTRKRGFLKCQQTKGAVCQTPEGHWGAGGQFSVCWVLAAAAVAAQHCGRQHTLALTSTGCPWQGRQTAVLRARAAAEKTGDATRRSGSDGGTFMGLPGREGVFVMWPKYFITFSSSLTFPRVAWGKWVWGRGLTAICGPLSLSTKLTSAEGWQREGPCP